MPRFEKSDHFKKFGKKDRSVRFEKPSGAPSSESGRNFLKRLSAEEESRVKSFFAQNFNVLAPYWSDKVLYKKVHSVWLCSEKAWVVQEHLRAKSVGLMLLQEFETMKTGKQAEYLFSLPE